MDDDEIICPSIRDIKEAVKNGANTLEEVEAATGAGTVCGACIGELEALIESLKNA